ncbi:MAG: HNH endonuclease [Sedimentisphaerales bacterium]|nr:HNH endonuclease [Sedimentisphaerales bacterium]
MPEYSFKFTLKIPPRLDRFLVVVVLLARRIYYGYPFRRVPLSQGKFTIVDPEDYEYLNQYKWCVSKSVSTWYAQRNVRVPGQKRQKCLQMHRLIMTPKLNALPEALAARLVVDHIDGNGLNNLKSNLRLALHIQNCHNQGKRLKIASSKYKGVSKCKNRNVWCTKISKKGVSLYLGTFKTEIEAARAYDRAAKKYHGRFARLNFPEKPHQYRGIAGLSRRIFKEGGHLIKAVLKLLFRPKSK